MGKAGSPDSFRHQKKKKRNFLAKWCISKGPIRKTNHIGHISSENLKDELVPQGTGEMNNWGGNTRGSDCEKPLHLQTRTLLPLSHTHIHSLTKSNLYIAQRS